ncbi:MAG: TraG/TraD/VirD4 family protein [Mycoplasmoidaceae bacterium]|nr:TraG/TraD/VirD4 family protein [Mycoplasmoidaceae bacterium]
MDTQSWIDILSAITNKKHIVFLHQSVLIDTAQSKQTFAGIKSTAAVALTFFSNAGVKYLTNQTDIDLNTFTDKPTALFISLSPNQTSTTDINPEAKLSSIYLQHLLTKINNLEDRESNPDVRPVMLIGEEAGNIPPIAGLSNLITIGLSKKIRCMLVFQSLSQLKIKYGREWDTIQENCGIKVIIKTQDTDLARVWSNSFGMTKRKTKSYNKNPEGKVTSTNYYWENVPVISQEEILHIPVGKILVWLLSNKPR